MNDERRAPAAGATPPPTAGVPIGQGGCRPARAAAIGLSLLLAIATPTTALPTTATPPTASPATGASAAPALPLAELIAERTVRFHADAAARDAAAPSLALAEPRSALGPAPAGFAVSPAFLRIAGRAAWRVDVEPGTSLYGTGEVPGPLLRDGRAVTCWNFDAFGYSEQTPHLYQSHPWVLAVRADGSAFGLLADTTWRCRVDLSHGVLFVAEGPPFPLIAIDGDSPQDVVRGLARLIGTLPLPPFWALGYHQCRYSYYPDARVLEVAREFRARHIPADVIWLDIDYMDRHRSFTFHPVFFPSPARMTAELRKLEFRTVAIIDPGVHRQAGYEVYDQGQALDAWVQAAGGGPAVGRVWPGDCVFPDFTRAEVRRWWGDLYGPFLARGIDGVWNDMNEPAVFTDSKTLPLDALHRADPELGGAGQHARYHNVYGMLMARATREGVLEARPNRRPFVLSRANYLGGQRYAAAWTGDNLADWQHLDWSIPMALNLGLSGQPFAGPDIGGFAGDGDGRLFARWMGFGALLPFARGHTGSGSADKEPWAFGEQTEATCRAALRRRYRLLPYLYTLFHEASRDGLPVVRPLFFADPGDPALRAADDAFLLGADLLVAARTLPDGEPGGPGFRPPRGDWRRVDLGVGDAGDADLPTLFLRAGAIVPLGPDVEWTAASRLDERLELLVCLDESGRAEGTLYEDAGDGHGFARGEYRLSRLTARREGGEVKVEARVIGGDWPTSKRRLVVRVANP